MTEWNQTKNDYENEKELKKTLNHQIEEQNIEINSLQGQLIELEKQMEELLIKKNQFQDKIDQYQSTKQQVEQYGITRLEDLNRQLVQAIEEQNQLIQNDNNGNQEPQVVELQIQSKQSREQNGKLKVEIEFLRNYTQIEIQEKLQNDKKSVELKGYAILDFTLFYFTHVIELQDRVESRESIQLDGLESKPLYHSFTKRFLEQSSYQEINFNKENHQGGLQQQYYNTGSEFQLEDEDMKDFSIKRIQNFV